MNPLKQHQMGTHGLKRTRGADRDGRRTNNGDGTSFPARPNGPHLWAPSDLGSPEKKKRGTDLGDALSR